MLTSLSFTGNIIISFFFYSIQVNFFMAQNKKKILIFVEQVALNMFKLFFVFFCCDWITVVNEKRENTLLKKMINKYTNNNKNLSNRNVTTWTKISHKYGACVNIFIYVNNMYIIVIDVCHIRMYGTCDKLQCWNRLWKCQNVFYHSSEAAYSFLLLLLILRVYLFFFLAVLT